MRKRKINISHLRKLLWICAILSFSVLLGFTSKKQTIRESKGVRIQIKDDNQNFFLEEGDIKELLNSKARKMVGKPMNDINIALLEKIV